MSKIDFCNDFAMDESDASLTVKQDCISLHFIINLIFLFSKKKKVNATRPRSQEHGHMESAFKPRCVWKTMFVPRFKGTTSQRVGLKSSFECCIFYGTERLYVELVDIELNAEFFIVSYDTVCFIE